jgi:hypothetical protein
MDMERKAVSNAVFAGVTVILLILAIAGFSLYASVGTRIVTQTSFVTTGTTVTSTSTLTSTKTQGLILSGALYNGTVVTFLYVKDYSCVPSLTDFFPNQTQATSKTQCVVGAGQANAEQGAVPLWVVVPAYAGLSIFGVQQFGATPSGFPTFGNRTIVTNCGAAGTPSACPFHPTYLYSPVFTLVEQHLGIQNGVFGLPEGVLPTPAHDHIISCCFQVIPWYTVVVLDFDPNIFPDPITGQCTQIVPSNLTNPTSNCLNSYEAIARALKTKSSAVSFANKDNPIWQTIGGPLNQIIVPGALTVSQLSNANSNLFEHFVVNSTNFYFPQNQR